MDDIVINEQLFAAFGRHLSANLNVLDVLYKLRQDNSDFDPTKDDPILLAVSEQEKIQRLIDLKYPEFVLACIKNLRVLDSCRDIFYSEIESDLVDLFTAALERFTQQAWIENTDRGFVIHSIWLIADVIIAPIGRVHSELLQCLDWLTFVMDRLGDNPPQVFLHSNMSTPESQYVQIWVASKLGISLAPRTGIIGVL